MALPTAVPLTPVMGAVTVVLVVHRLAIVLTLGIGTSMFTALMGSRALLTLMYGGKRKLARLPI